jgi:succinate dehydrogenase hydrophobic anchor subunit
MDPNNTHSHVHPAITAVTLVLLVLALVGALIATGTLP